MLEASRAPLSWCRWSNIACLDFHLRKMDHRLGLTSWKLENTVVLPLAVRTGALNCQQGEKLIYSSNKWFLGPGNAPGAKRNAQHIRRAQKVQGRPGVGSGRWMWVKGFDSKGSEQVRNE